MRVGFSLYLITDGNEDDRARAAQALAASPTGKVAIMLRAPGSDGGALTTRARLLLRQTSKFGASLFINDRLDVALAVGADGVHLPARGLPTKIARRVAPHLLIGASTHSLGEAIMAARGGADLVTFGPVWPTPGKGPPVGVAALAEVVGTLPIPVFALGGVDSTTVHSAFSVGARAACIRAVLASTDPARAVISLLEPWATA